MIFGVISPWRHRARFVYHSFKVKVLIRASTTTMKDHVYKLTELTGTSAVSMEDAVTRAIQCAYQSVKTLSWFQVVETRGSIKDGAVDRWQVTLKVGFTVEEPELPAPE